MANYKVKAADMKIIADIKCLTQDELTAVKNYIALGYKLEEKKKSSAKVYTKDEMEELLSVNEELKADFLEAYSIKKKDLENKKDFIKSLEEKYQIRTTTKKDNTAYTGYYLACQIFNKWLKEKKAEEKKAKEMTK